MKTKIQIIILEIIINQQKTKYDNLGTFIMRENSNSLDE